MAMTATPTSSRLSPVGSATGIVVDPYSSGVPYAYPSATTVPASAGTVAIGATVVCSAGCSTDWSSSASARSRTPAAVTGDMTPSGTPPSVAVVTRTAASGSSVQPARRAARANAASNSASPATPRAAHRRRGELSGVWIRSAVARSKKAAAVVGAIGMKPAGGCVNNRHCCHHPNSTTAAWVATTPAHAITSLRLVRPSESAVMPAYGLGCIDEE